MNDLSSLKLFEHSSASRSVDREGKIIKAGKNQIRIAVTTDSRFFVAARIFHAYNLIDQLLSLFGGRYYVSLKVGEQKLLVNINSISKRLHVKPEKVREAAKKGDLEAFIKKRTKKAMEEVATAIYQECVAKGKEEGDELILDGSKTKVPKAKLKEAVEKGEAYFIDSITDRVWTIWCNRETHEVEVGTVGKKLGQGSYGKVHEYEGFQTPEVVKHPRKKAGRDAIQDLLNEKHQLDHIHQNGRVYGVQVKPRWMRRMFMRNKHGHIKPKLAYATSKYTRDYDAVIYDSKTPPSVETYLRQIYQLAAGLAYLADHDYLCGDLKPANVFVKTNPDGTEELAIGDFGGVCHINEVKSPTKLEGFSRAATPGYSSLEDLSASACAANSIIDLENGLRREGRASTSKGIWCYQQEIEKTKQKLVQIEKKRDVFSLGSLFYEALTQRLPYNDGTTVYLGVKWPNLATYQELKTTGSLAGLPQEIKDLIKSMVDPSRDKRPSAREVFQTIDTCMEKKFPSLRQQLHQDIKKNYPGSVELIR
jgi:serine/threonine protein kinase